MVADDDEPAPPIELLAVSGSLREGSTNQATLRTVRQFAPAGVRITLFDGMSALPHFNPDDDYPPLPPPVGALRERIGAADGLLVCTPEYAGALPGSFKNLLDWTVGGPEMAGKPIAWINVSGVAAPTGGAGAHDSLRSVLGYVGAVIVEAACVRVPLSRQDVDAAGLIQAPQLRGALVEAVSRLAEHTRQATGGQPEP